MLYSLFQNKRRVVMAKSEQEKYYQRLNEAADRHEDENKVDEGHSPSIIESIKNFFENTHEGS